MTQLCTDSLIAIRQLARSWRIVLVAGVTIALAVAATATTMTVVSAVLLRPLPFPDSNRLYRVLPFNARGESIWISVPTLRDWQERVRGVTLAGLTILDFNVLGDGAPQSILAARITPAFFDTLGMRPSIGRGFTSDEHGAGGEQSVILSYDFWQSRYGGDRSIVGRRIRLSGPEFVPDSSGDYVVVGILPQRFWLFWKRIEIVIPLRLTPAQLSNRGRPAIETVVARLMPDTAEGGVAAQLREVTASLSAQYGSSEPVTSVSFERAQSVLYKDFTAPLLVVLTSAVLMFVLAAVNVTAMLIALALARRREFAIRAALGAQKRWFVTQALAEGAVLGALGGSAGLILSVAGTSLIRTIVPSQLVNFIPGEASAITLDWPIVASVAGAVALMSLLCAAVTFLASHTAQFEAALRSGSRGITDTPRHWTVRRGILAFQMVVAVALVVATTNLSLDLVQLRSTEMGFNPDNLFTVWLNLDPRRHPVARERADYYQRMLERVTAVPGVASVGGIDLPFNLGWQKTRVMLPEQRITSDDELSEALSRTITSDYFSTMAIPLVAGRVFETSDAEGALPVAIVSQTLAKKLWPGANPVGRQVRATGTAVSDEPWLTVVGVAADVRRAPQEAPAAALYRPLRQKTPPWLYLMVRTSASDIDITAGVRQAVWSEDPDQPIEGPSRIATWVHDMTASLRFVVIVGATFSILGALLAFTGVYGLTADLSQRAVREIGIRKALGATTARILGLFVHRSVRLCLPPVVAGSCAGVGVLRLIASEIGPTTSSAAWSIPLVAGGFAALVVAATFLSSRKAATVDPAVTMRAE